MVDCEEWRRQAMQTLTSAYEPVLSLLNTNIDALEKGGGDPKKQVIQGIVVDLYEKRDFVKGQLASDSKEVVGKYKECLLDDKWAIPQTAVDYAIFLATGGLSSTFPPEVFHVDIKTILEDGKPLGGDGALVPKARDDLLNALGIGGDVAATIKDPGKSAYDTVKPFLPPIPGITW